MKLYRVVCQTYRGTGRPAAMFAAEVGSDYDERLLGKANLEIDWVACGIYDADQPNDAVQQAWEKHTLVDSEGLAQWK